MPTANETNKIASASPVLESFWLYGTHSIPIYYEDTDFSGYVYHANFIKFCERAREHLLSQELLKELYAQDLHFVVKRAELNFLQPVRFADTLDIRSQAQVTRSPLIAFQQDLYFLKEPDRLAVQAKVDLVMVNSSGRPQRIHDQALRLLFRRCSPLPSPAPVGATSTPAK
jgi:acyl-CoA thioester hydrolase